ncbi:MULTISPECIES: protein-disulfide reductase DsbD domain-containing protein [unclassified Rhizobium]|jgi:DsbC/DsbD-like thiol-disulfide interchange protein|uniref:protein-disulfide reductase DsbD domain-containing protein n=1 Tax=unclassified Rhizobium TaxID=2613769 RepID=UPI0006460DA9|nr:MULTISPECIES: protein-disulfide reductase DsbD domain-containing protein [unclassified Rhizobium]MBN8950453.1 cytochrome C biogenesis protein [Rhizobium tropici]OJY68975.1 MAG: cytochrome C biogenesis protein [Rhizobium sp. 60-20]RKD74248.1 DsbC/DsbD-like thiol-disulfide interchange protein [Rhizobium sp. WW_1]
MIEINSIARLSALVATLFFSATAAHAATSEWVDNEGGRIRLIALAPDAEGHIRAALQIEPEPGWITYWREPGQGGIPPQITPAPGSGVTLEKISYPIPKPISVGPIQEIGYDAPVTLPLDLHVAGKAPEKLELTTFIGLCKDICIPFQAELSLPLTANEQPTSHELATLDAAKAMLPQAPSSDFAIRSHTISADAKSLSLQLTLPETSGKTPEIYVTGPSGYVFFRQANAKREGTAFSADIEIGKLPKDYDPKGKSWGVLVIDGARAMETTLALE